MHDLIFCHLLRHNLNVQAELGARKVNFSRLLAFMHKLDWVVVHSFIMSKECNWGAQLKTLCTMNLEVALLGVF